nr:hypothetical protein Itr_chr12CG17600 [Ipomoea trifida]
MKSFGSVCLDIVALNWGSVGRWEQGAHLGSKVPDHVGQPTLWPLRSMGVRCPSREQADLMALEADGSKVPVSGANRPYGPRGRREQGARLGSKVPDLVGQPTLWPSRSMGARCPSREQGARFSWSADLMAFEADGSKVPISGVRCLIILVSRPYGLRGRWEQGAHLGSKVPDYLVQPTLWPLRPMGARSPSREQGARSCKLKEIRRTRLGVGPGAGVGHFVGEQRHHGGKIGLLEALGQGCVNLLLDGSAARRKIPLPVYPSEFVPDLRVDEGETCFWRGTTSFSRMPSNARARLKRSVVVWVSWRRRGRSGAAPPPDEVSVGVVSGTLAIGGSAAGLAAIFFAHRASFVLGRGAAAGAMNVRSGNIPAPVTAEPPVVGTASDTGSYFSSRPKSRGSRKSIFFRVVECSMAVWPASVGCGSDELVTVGACDDDVWRGFGADELASPGAGSARGRDEASEPRARPGARNFFGTPFRANEAATSSTVRN